jgi:hypothetical protein
MLPDSRSLHIHNQEAHHKRISFADEFKKFLATHGMREEK